MAFFRHDKTDPNASQKPLQVGTKLFVEELSKRFFSASDDIIMMVIFEPVTSILPFLECDLALCHIFLGFWKTANSTLPQPMWVQQSHFSHRSDIYFV